MKKFLAWANFLLRRAAIRIAVTFIILSALSYAVPKAVLAISRIEARKAGYELTADKTELRVWEVRLYGVRASGARADLTARAVRVRFDGRLRVEEITAEGADVTLKETKREPGRGERRKISLYGSTVRVNKSGLQATLTVRRAVLDKDGRVWADADAVVRSGTVSAIVRGLRTEGMTPGGPIDVRAKSVDVALGEREPERAGQTKAIESIPVRLSTDELTINGRGVNARAQDITVDITPSAYGKKYHVQATTLTVNGNCANQVVADVERDTDKPETTSIEATAEALDTENRKFSNSEFSIRKLHVKGIVLRSEGSISVKDATVRVGGARVNVSASLDAGEASLRAEMPEVGCQELLESLPRELVPRLLPQEGGTTRMSGTTSWRTEVTVDLPARKKPDVSIWLRNKCIVESVPDELNVQRLQKPFRHEEYSADGKRITGIAGPGTANWTPLGAMSPFMPIAVMATEDPSFMSHRGILIQAIENSMEQNITAGKFIRGGSTISMQLAKNLWLAREKTLSRKIQEAVLTTYLEQKLSKTQMIELYLNIVEFGPNLYGIGPAARRYFAKEPGGLSLSQSLFLASLLPSPTSAGFEEGKKVSQGRLEFLRKVMKMMLDRGTIGQTQYEQGLRETPVFGEPSSSGEPDQGPKSPGGIDPSEWK